MPELDHTFPSGLRGIIKGWSVHDLSVFANRAMLKKPGPAVEAHLMRASWMDTLSTGPYAFTGSPPWLGEVLQGDLTDGIRQARILTWGEMCPYDFRCEDPLCREKIPRLVNLAELPTIPLSDEGLDVFENGNSISWRFPICGKEIVYGLPTGRSMVLADKLAKQHGRSLHVMWASRIRSIEGVKSPAKFPSFLGSLDPRDGLALEEELERLNCGVDTTVDDLVCESCSLEQEQDFPFGVDFFTPRKEMEERKRARRAKLKRDSGEGASQPESRSDQSSDDESSTNG